MTVDQDSSFSTDSLSSFHSDDLVSIQDLIEKNKDDRSSDKNDGVISSLPKVDSSNSAVTNVNQEELSSSFEKLQLVDKDNQQTKDGIMAEGEGKSVKIPLVSNKVVSPERKALVHNFLNQTIPKKSSLNLFPLSPSVHKSKSYLPVVKNENTSLPSMENDCTKMTNQENASVFESEEKRVNNADVFSLNCLTTEISSKGADKDISNDDLPEAKHDLKNEIKCTTNAENDDEPNLTGAGDDKRKLELISELRVLRKFVKNANFSLKSLKEIYGKRKDEDCKLSFPEMRSLYAEQVFAQGKLSKEVSRLRMEVRSANKSLGSINWELDHIKGRQRADNPWQIGVPYGYRAVNGRTGRKK